MKINRIEAFTDAIVAIIMTIMVLEIKVPEIDSLKGILKEIPYLISFVISFYTFVQLGTIIITF
nr:TMEM175 family protein [Enterococcus faecalis]